MPAILGVRHSPLDASLPPDACDCHTHVFGPSSRFPFDRARTYTPPDASVDELLAHQRTLGLDRVVIVQPSTYGTDNACTLDAVSRLGARARAVAVVDPALDGAELRALHERGVRGLRVNLETAGVADPVEAGRLLQRAAEQAAPQGWHVQAFTNLAVLAALHDHLLALPVPLVIDHFAHAPAAGGVQQAGFGALLDLVRRGRAFVKLSAAHRIAPLPDAVGPIAVALIAANPAQMLWGSDWPHPGAGPRIPAPTAGEAHLQPFDPIDDGAALNRLRRWAGSEETLRVILVDNPARLYGFP